jgi:iron-sulfur cluster assembly protein
MLIEQVQQDQVTLTSAAALAVHELLEKRNLPDMALRVFVSGGGCSGFQYGMALEDKIRETDLVYEMGGVKMVVDEISINYLRGATVDYVDTLMGTGFKIENPNAVASCGCGNSFRTKDSSSESGEGSSCGCS